MAHRKTTGKGEGGGRYIHVVNRGNCCSCKGWCCPSLVMRVRAASHTLTRSHHSRPMLYRKIGGCRTDPRPPSGRVLSHDSAQSRPTGRVNPTRVIALVSASDHPGRRGYVQTVNGLNKTKRRRHPALCIRRQHGNLRVLVTDFFFTTSHSVIPESHKNRGFLRRGELMSRGPRI